MHIYKFRILLEDNEQFFREIDVKANQTFEVFHQTLAASAGFDLSEMSSFYICDSKWNKQLELCLCDMSAAGEDPLEEEDDLGKKKPALPVRTMCDTRLKDVIIDPHQHIIYVYDFLKMYTFYIELFKIKEADEKVQYPLIVKSTGAIAKPPTPITDDDEEDDASADIDDFNDDDGPSEDSMFEGSYDEGSFN